MCPRASGRGQPIPLARPVLGPEEEQACVRVLRSGVLVQGPEAEALESEFAARVGARHAVAVSSGTAALHLALMALGVGPGDEVIVPAYTFIATANAVRLTGADVTLADVQADSLNLDPDSCGALLGPNTRVVIPVHQYGLPADLPRLAERLPDLMVLEDAACAVGAATPGGPVGRPVGRAVCFSFHPRKVITTGEGGLITTDDDALAARLRSLRQHGQGVDGTVEPGYNFRLSELSAAIGRVQLGRLDRFLAQRARVAGWYEAGLSDLSWLRLPPRSGPNGAHVYQSFVVQVADGAPLSREALIRSLREQGVGCQAGVSPIHHHRPYRQVRRVPLPRAERAGGQAVFLPMHADLDEAQVDRICAALHRAG